eukprot:TRINITY_DN383_c1_g3_i2.p1 TRINITY_DN383_c1_g3~~TRINITY_DN383_c1_g3_i2.p1  ORF type:complete len:734 (+),score=173.13 TRINITY_DN383_c1_g3_i2:46-2247(+)
MASQPLAELLTLLSRTSAKDTDFVESLQTKLKEAIKGVAKEELQQAAETAARASHNLDSWRTTVDTLTKLKGPLAFKKAQGVILRAFTRIVISSRSFEICSDKARYVSHLADRISFLEHCIEEYGRDVPSQVAFLEDSQANKKYLCNGTILLKNDHTTCIEGEVVGDQPELVALRISEKAVDADVLSSVAQITARLTADSCVKFITSFKDQDSGKEVVVTEHHGVSLQQATKKQQLSHRQVYQLFSQLVGAISDIHSAGFVLGNLNLSGVMVSTCKKTANLSAKISLLDSHFVNGVFDVNKCDKLFVAPEVLQTSQCSQSGDIYAIGVIMSTVIVRCLAIKSSEVLSSLQQQDVAKKPTAIGAQQVSQFKLEMKSACQGEWKSREYFVHQASQFKTVTQMAEALQNNKKKINSLKEENNNLKRKLEKCAFSESSNSKQEDKKQLENYIKEGVKFTPAQLPESIMYASKVEYGGKVYITGGDNDHVQVFDIAANTLSVLPNKLTNKKSHHSSCLIDETIYNFGGIIGIASTSSVESMDILEGVWGAENKLPSRRHSLSSSVIGERAFLFGGYLSDYTATDEVLVYNAATDRYSSGGKMLQKRSGHISEEVGGCALIAGGGSYSGNYLNSCELFDGRALKSVEAAPLDYKVSAHASSKLTETTVVISGGFFGLGFKSEISLFDTRTNKWNKLGARLATARHCHLQVTLDTNKIIVFGGAGASNVGNNVEVIDLRL